MDVAALDYALPPELIAQTPAARRDDARMLLLDRGAGRWEHRRVAELPELLRRGDLLVVNDARVLPARVPARKPSGGRVELLLLEPASGEPGLWRSMARPSRRLRAGLVLEAGAGRVELAGRDPEEPGLWLVRPGLAPGQRVEEWLEAHGQMPVPPYIHRGAPGAQPGLDALDRERYQTVYARAGRAVAAPTAGLHFTPELLARLEGRGIRRAAVTLHVGAGTFLPVKTARLADHPMHGEQFEVSAPAAGLIRAARAAGGRIVAVGTTVARTLESAPEAILAGREAGGTTRLFIYPPFTFRAVDALLTNFHLPRSTLLALVSAFAGLDLIRAAYAAAIRERYRFYSYGDCMLIV